MYVTIADGLALVLMMVSLAAGKHDNFCRPLEDYGPRYDNMEEREVCGTTFQKSCEVIRASDCMNVTELACEVGNVVKILYSLNTSL